MKYKVGMEKVDLKVRLCADRTCNTSVTETDREQSECLCSGWFVSAGAVCFPRWTRV